MSQTDWKKSLNSSKTIINLFAHDGIVSHYTGVGTITINYIYSLKKIFPTAVINLITPSYNKNSLGYSMRIEKLNSNIIASNNGKIYKLSNGSKGFRSFGDISNWNVLSKNSAKLIKLIHRNNKKSRILNIFFDTPYAGIFEYLENFAEKNKLISIWVPHSTAKIHKIDSALPDSDKNMKERINWELSAINRVNKTKGCYVASIGEYMTEHLHGGYGVKKNKIVPFYNGLYQGRTHLEGKRLTADEKKSLGLKRSSKIMLCFGRAEPYKNLEAAIKLAGVLEPLGIESILIVAPYSKNQPILKIYRQLQKLYCPNLKLILDADFDLPHKIMNSSLSLTIVFIPSKREPFGLIVEEARKCNRKILVVANNTGGLRNQISDLHDGILVDVSKTEEIKQKIYKMINDKTITNKIVYEGRKTLKERYDLTKNLEIGLEKIINGV